MKDLFYKGCALFCMVVVLMTTIPAALAHTYAGAPAYHHWTPGEQLNSADLNNTFDHIHNTFSGNIADAHISATAAIQHSKMQFPQVLPKAAAYVAADCSADPCTLAYASRIATINHTGTGVYAVHLSYVANNNVYGAQVGIMTAGTVDHCIVGGMTTTQFTVTCKAGGAAADTGLMVTVYDDNN